MNAAQPTMVPHRSHAPHATAERASLLPLDPVQSTLLIPLAARAHGGRLFPHMAVHDAHALAVLEATQAPVQCFLDDRLSVYGVLARTHTICQLAQDFFRRHPGGWGANLGCGLSHYFQWLSSGHNHWLDADLPPVMRWRQQLLAVQRPGYRQAVVDLKQPHWWQALQLPQGRQGAPVLLILEGVLMYLQAEQVRQLLREFARHAPPGSELLCDSLSWLAIGAAARHPSVCHTGAQFSWGPRHLSEFTDAHPRLQLLSEHQVLGGFDPLWSWLCLSFRALWGVPLYAVLRLGVKD